jgi:Flp pilus assembly protein protease CpaA
MFSEIIAAILHAVDSPAAHAIVTALIVTAGILDYRTHKVSNWISLPVFFARILTAALRLGNTPLPPEFVGAMIVGGLVLGLYFTSNTPGEADVKIIVGLCGLWPAAGIASLAGGSILGLAVLLWKGKGHEYPMLSGAAVAVVLAFFAAFAGMLV